MTVYPAPVPEDGVYYMIHVIHYNIIGIDTINPLTAKLEAQNL